MNNKLDRLLFFWVPTLAIFLYCFSFVIELHTIKKFFGALPLWGWLIAYFVTMFFVRSYLRSLGGGGDSRIDYTSKAMSVSSDIIIVFLFSVISFVLIMLLLGNSLKSAMNLSN